LIWSIHKVINDLKASLVFLGPDSADIITQQSRQKHDNDKQHTFMTGPKKTFNISTPRQLYWSLQ